MKITTFPGGKACQRRCGGWDLGFQWGMVSAGTSPCCRMWGWPIRQDMDDFGSFLLFTEILWILLLLFAPQFVCSAFQPEVCHKCYKLPLCPSFKL